MKKKLTPILYLKNGKAILNGLTESESEQSSDAATLAKHYSDNGADTILVLDLSSDSDAAHEANIGAMKELIRVCDIPVYAGGIVKRFEDTKKYLYTGAMKALVYFTAQTVDKEIQEAVNRFGSDKLLAVIDDVALFETRKELIETASKGLIFLNATPEKLSVLKSMTTLPIYAELPNCSEEQMITFLKEDTVIGISSLAIAHPDFDFMKLKQAGKAAGLPMNLAESKLSWNQLKLNSDGMIPVIVQDYKTDEVLMLAYMNENAFNETIQSGKMTYWSRSRNELWKKGLTSGHFQYMKSLTADCDYDTILAKVSQVGAACHTGKYSCFFNELLKVEYQDTNPLKVFEDVYQVIMDRKEHPKEGSYTNYLFDKGIDKILKKVGEEATELVIAAKNPDPEEIKYELSDFLYHAMVLMAERGVTWEDITRELAQR